MIRAFSLIGVATLALGACADTASSTKGIDHGGAPAAGVVVGLGTVSGHEVVVVANDATVKAGAWFPLTCKKVLRAQEIAMRCQAPALIVASLATTTHSRP